MRGMRLRISAAACPEGSKVEKYKAGNGWCKQKEEMYVIYGRLSFNKTHKNNCRNL